MEEEHDSPAIQHEMHLLSISQRRDTSTTRSRIPLFLGFFMQSNMCIRYSEARFLHCSEEGKGLHDGEWGSLDAPLRFLHMPTNRIVGSSNGLLLCSPDFWDENSIYVVCNPVTRVFEDLPRPHKVYKFVSLTFTCKSNDECASLDRIEYEVVRIGIPSFQTCCTTYEVETFSSLAWEWKRSRLVSGLPFKLCLTNVPGFVLNDVIYLQDPREILLAYDRSKGADQENIQPLNFPKDDGTVSYGDQVSLSEGKLYYARSTDGCHIELWVLSDCKRAEWVLKQKVSYTEIKQNNPNVRISLGISVGHVHPCKSHLIFLITDNIFYCYDFESGIMHEVATIKHSLYDQFLYEWPCTSNSTGSGCEFHSRL